MQGAQSYTKMRHIVKKKKIKWIWSQTWQAEKNQDYPKICQRLLEYKIGLTSKFAYWQWSLYIKLDS